MHRSFYLLLLLLDLAGPLAMFRDLDLAYFQERRSSQPEKFP